MAGDSPCDFTQYLGRVRGLLDRYATREYPVNDLLQETLAEAYHSVRARGPPNKPQQWLLKVAYRTAVTKLRERDRHRSLLQVIDPVDEDAIDPFDHAVTTEAHDRVAHGIEQLRPHHKQVLEGFYLDGHSCRELSDRIGISYDAVKLRLSRARRRLRALLEVDVNPE